jgi:hypothetical protein
MRSLSLLLTAVLVSALGGAAQAKPEKKRPEQEVTMAGRVFVRWGATSVEDADAVGKLEVASARLELRYRFRDYLRAVVEVEVSGNPKLKDGYLSLRKHGFELRAGQFKMPTTRIEMSSEWKLPVLDRGLVSDVLVDRALVGGRRPGLTVGYTHECALEPTLVIGAFRADEPSGEWLIDPPVDAMNLVGRLSMTVAGIEIGVGGELRRTHPYSSALLSEMGTYGSASADVSGEVPIGPVTLRFWIDGFLGEHFYGASLPETSTDAVHDFLGGRAIVAVRHGGRAERALFVEGFVMGSLLDPDRDVTGDLGSEIRLGVSAGLWELARATIEVSRSSLGDHFPAFVPNAAEPPDPIAAEDRFLVQLGLSF